MEKLASRHSGGGGKLGTLDMQSYLEVMGRQLAEIQAQHHQFYASRQDRVGRLRSQDQPQLMKRWSSDSTNAPQHPGGQTSLEGQAPSGDMHSPEDHVQQVSPSIGGSSSSGAAARSSSASHGGARRSLNYPGDASADSGAGSGAGGSRHVAGSGQSTALTGGASTVGRPRPQGRSRSASKQITISPAVSVSPSVSNSISPSSASFKPQSSTPRTPSTSNAPTGAALPVAARHGAASTDTSPVGPYAAYDACGGASVSYTTPETHGGDYPLTASVSSSSQGAWLKSRPATASATPSPRQLGMHGQTPSTASVVSSAVAVHGRGSRMEDATIVEDDDDDDDELYAIALAGQAFDGIDSEEDDELEPAGKGRRSSVAGASQSSCQPSSSFQAANGNVQDTNAAVAASVDSAAGRGTGRMVQPSEDGSKQMGKRAVPQLNLSAVTSGPRPQSRSGPRTPLVVASLETEEALRALLATPRRGMGDRVAVGASIEGLEVPDDVLAALAKTDGMDLDVALVAAMAASIREQVGQEHAGYQPAPARPSTQGQGQGSHAPVAGPGRHLALGPGALTAAPAAVPASATVRGLDASLRSNFNATGRAANAHGAVGMMHAAGLPPRGAPQQHHHVQHTESPVDASIELDHLDTLSQTIDMSDEANRLAAGTLRDSATCAAAAMAAQRVAAQQHAQPVLYSLAPRPSGAAAGGPAEQGSRRNTVDGGSRRTTADGGSRRTTADGGSRRNTADGTAALSEFVEEATSTPDKEAQARHHGAVAAGTVAAGNGAMRAGSRPATASTSSTAAAAGHPPSAPGRGLEDAPAAVSPSKVPRGSATNASPSAPSSAVRDGDMVLYGSPSHKTTGVDTGASPSVAASPYVAPSPPPGADPSPYMISPLASHASSRLQRNSRNLDDGVAAGPRKDVDSQAAHAGEDDAAATVTASGLRPWSAAAGGPLSTSRRQLAQPAASGASSGTNSVNLDLSLTQAAAMAASSNRPQTGSVTSPTDSLRQIRVPALSQVQVSQQHESRSQPAYSSFSVATLSPSARGNPQVASYDLEVDDVGRPMLSPSPSPRGTTASASAVSDSASPVADTSKASQPTPPVGPPLASFSRAAALAAAADVGLSAQRPPGDGRPPTVAMGAHATAIRAPAADADAVASAATHGSGRGWPHSQEGVQPEFGRRELVSAGKGAPLPGDQVAGGSVAYVQPSDLAHGQSPGPPSVASSSAKLSQLKARRQQQWQSQHGLNGQAADQSLSTLGSAAQQPGPLPQEQQRIDGSQQPRHHGPPPTADRNRSGVNRGLAAGSRGGPALSDPAAAAAALDASQPPPHASAGAPLLPEAVAAAIARAASGRQDVTASGELNLGHGISGLSVAIEAGQVKWAWQTDAKGKPAPVQVDAASPGASSSGSPWASPAAAPRAGGESGSDWAVQQLPAPQWKRHGHMPAEARRQEDEEREEYSAVAASREQPQRQDSAHRRQSEYSLMVRHLANLPPSLLQHHYAVSAGGSSTPEPHQLRHPSASEAGGQANSKAMAILRLKRQSIARHNVQVAGAKEPDGQSGAQQSEQQPRQQPVPPPSQPHHGSRGGSGGSYQQQQRHVPVPRVSEHADVREHGSRAWAQGADDAGGVEAEGSQAQSKPFLRRRSAKVQARKVDWSHVKPRTNSRNPDYSPEVVLKTRVSPLSSPKGGVAKPPLNINVGARGRKPGVKVAQTPTEEEKVASAVAAARRRMSNIPIAPVPAAANQAPAVTGEDKRGISVGGAVRGSGTGTTPLDDLLAHVNTLLRDFDKMVL